VEQPAAAPASDTSAAAPRVPLGILALIACMARFIDPHWRRAAIVIGLVFGMILSSALPFSFKFIVDDGLVGRNHRLLRLLANRIDTAHFARLLASDSDRT